MSRIDPVRVYSYAVDVYLKQRDAITAVGDFTRDVVDVYKDAKDYISRRSIDGSVKEEATAGIDRLIEHTVGRKPFPSGALPKPEALPDPASD